MKSSRHTKILELINRYPITTQDELLMYLKGDGYDVTQSTVSRDIKQLKLSKSTDENGKYRYRVPQSTTKPRNNNLLGLVSDSVVSVEPAMNIVVIKTYSGMAQAVCATLDTLESDSVVGTIAGEDTIMVVCRDINSADKFCSELSNYIN